jgi:hypothetical protein
MGPRPSKAKYLPLVMPVSGFAEDSPYSSVLPGHTPSALNVMPRDPGNKRTRLGTRSGAVAIYDFPQVGEEPATSNQLIQHVGTYRIYGSSGLEERLLIVANGRVYTMPANGMNPVEVDEGILTPPFLNATGPVEGVQYGPHYYLVDGDNYIKVQLDATPDPVASTWAGPAAFAAGGGTATLIAVIGARIMLAGLVDAPNNWAFSGVDDPEDWTFGATLGVGAVAGDSGTRLGRLGQPITCIAPIGRSGALIGCIGSMSMITSDPALPDVQMVELSRVVGVVGPRAWCPGPEQSVLVLGYDGLYYVTPNTFAIERANRLTAGKLDSAFLRLNFGSSVGAVGAFIGGGTLAATGGGATPGTLKPDGSGYVDGTQEGGIGPPITEPDAPEPPPDPDPDPDPDPEPDPPPEEEPPPSRDPGDRRPFNPGLDPPAADPGGPITDAVLVWDHRSGSVWIFLGNRIAPIASLHYAFHLSTLSAWPIRLHDPRMPAPTCACSVQGSRIAPPSIVMGSAWGRLSIISDERVTGIDGYMANPLGEQLPEDAQEYARIRSHLAIGPVSLDAPFRSMARDLRLDMGEQVYTPPPGLVATCEPPRVTISLGETAEQALGVDADAIEFFQPPEYSWRWDAGNLDDGPRTLTANLDGAEIVATPRVLTGRADGRYPGPPFGVYRATDSLAAPAERVYAGPWGYSIQFDPLDGTWACITPYETGVKEYEQVSPSGTPDGVQYLSEFQTFDGEPVGDYAFASGASLPGSRRLEVGILHEGRNEAMRMRLRAEALYVTVGAVGCPWVIERGSMLVEPVGPSRGIRRTD